MISSKQLREAIWRGDAVAVDAMIAAGADINDVDADGHFSPLQQAIEQNYSDIVRRLIAAGADVNAETDNGWTPLAHAIDSACDAAWQKNYEQGHESVEIPELLLAAGAVITPRALLTATNYGSEKMLALLHRYRGEIGRSAD